MTPLDPDRLLRVDVLAEVRKLAEAQIEPSWQLPAELVRLALHQGARRVEVFLRPARLVVRQDGPGLSPALLHALADLLDEALPPARRHGALLRLEAEAALGLIALAGLRYSRLRIEGGGEVLIHDRHRRPVIQEAQGGQSRVALEGFRFDAERARSWVETACRFAPAQVCLEGEDLPSPFPDALVVEALPAPLRGLIALPRGGDVARVWVLRDGVVAAHLTLADTPCFEAALEAPPRGGANSAAAREAAVPCLEAMARRAQELALALGGRLETLDESGQRRVRHLLLECTVRSQAVRSELFALPLFPALLQGDARPFSLLELGKAAAIKGSLPALYPDQDPRRYLLPDVAFVLDAQERSALGTLLGLSFVPCVPRPASPALKARVVRVLAATRAAAWRALLRLLHPGDTALHEVSLSPSERALLSALSRELGARPGGGELRLGRGSGPVRMRRGQGWLLPRRNPLVRASLRLAGRDQRWLYPAALALFEGRAPLREEARRAWRKGPTSPPGR